jgi:hypothetical protein
MLHFLHHNAAEAERSLTVRRKMLPGRNRELLETTMGKRLGEDCAIEICDAKRHLLFE